MRDAIGIGIALAIVLAWGLSLVALLGLGVGTIPASLWLPAVAVQTFLHTGLFITAHDAMHASIAPTRPRWNDALGRIAIGLYALFSYRSVRRKHDLHHERPVREADPDYHDGGRDRFWPWYVAFMREYLGLGQVVGLAVVFNALHHLVGIDLASLSLFWVVPSLASTLQLFAFGTYVPHRRPRSGHSDQTRATSSELDPWLSFLACYHFGYHREHHLHPDVPWWRLPEVRRRLDR